jgi:hypothetical protein
MHLFVGAGRRLQMSIQRLHTARRLSRFCVQAAGMLLPLCDLLLRFLQTFL